MQTHLIRITPDTEGWYDWTVRKIKENPATTIGLGIAAAPFLLLEAPIAAAVGGVVTVAGLGVDAFTSAPAIELVQFKSAADLVDVHGKRPSINEIYARHPDKARSNLVFHAPSFHSEMIGEQIADLITYIRGAVKTREIEIAVYSEKGAKLDAVASSSSGLFGIQAHAGSVRHHSAGGQYDDPEPISHDDELYWMRVFPEVKAMLKGATKGVVSRSMSVDTTFGLTASLASSAGIDANWLGKQRFDIRVVFG